MLALWCFTVALSSSPALHHLLHSDSGDLTHQCLVTAFQKSSLAGGAVVPLIVIVAAVPFSEHAVMADVLPFQSTDLQLLPTRGPPSILSA